jgi:hypothetical protein
VLVSLTCRGVTHLANRGAYMLNFDSAGEPPVNLTIKAFDVFKTTGLKYLYLHDYLLWTSRTMSSNSQSEDEERANLPQVSLHAVCVCLHRQEKPRRGGAILVTPGGR